jgi:creatinine amidohydrolase
LVLLLETAGSGEEKKNRIEAFQEKWAWTERKWSQVTADTGIGNPKKATAEKGKAFFEDVTNKLADLMVDLTQVPKDKLYQ